MPNAPWTLTKGLCFQDDDACEYNPEGFWLGNTEVNQIFILPEDLEKVSDLLSVEVAVIQLTKIMRP